MDYFDRILGINEKEHTDDVKLKTDHEKESFRNLNSSSEKTGKKPDDLDEIFGISASKTADAVSEKQIKEKKKKPGWHMIFSIFVIFVLIPAVFIICIRAGDKRLYIGSIIIMLLAMLPFFVNFEHRKPDARELVTLSVLIAVAVVSRIAFMWLPAFKPMAGFIVITAMCFGPQAGFMSGALSMLLSNIVFGQGAWTPWQMFCYGMIGFIGGLLARFGIISVSCKIRSGIIAFFTVTVLSSVILDSSTLFFMFSKISKSSILTVYISGLPINVLNGLASGLAVVLLSKPISVIIARIKAKYIENTFKEDYK